MGVVGQGVMNTGPLLSCCSAGRGAPVVVCVTTDGLREAGDVLRARAGGGGGDAVPAVCISADGLAGGGNAPGGGGGRCPDCDWGGGGGPGRAPATFPATAAGGGWSGDSGRGSFVQEASTPCKSSRASGGGAGICDGRRVPPTAGGAGGGAPAPEGCEVVVPSTSVGGGAGNLLAGGGTGEKRAPGGVSCGDCDTAAPDVAGGSPVPFPGELATVMSVCGSSVIRRDFLGSGTGPRRSSSEALTASWDAAPDPSMAPTGAEPSTLCDGFGVDTSAPSCSSSARAARGLASDCGVLSSSEGSLGGSDRSSEDRANVAMTGKETSQVSRNSANCEYTPSLLTQQDVPNV
jgi:hypothetical protein